MVPVPDAHRHRHRSPRLRDPLPERQVLQALAVLGYRADGDDGTHCRGNADRSAVLRQHTFFQFQQLDGDRNGGDRRLLRAGWPGIVHQQSHPAAQARDAAVGETGFLILRLIHGV